MSTPKNPFERDGYRAKEFGTVASGNSSVHFDVVAEEDAKRLLGEDTIIGRIAGRIVISDQVRPTPSTVSPIKRDLLNTIDEDFPEESDPLHQSQVIREFIEVEQELTRLSRQ